ncbi:hypothetical protein SMD10_23935, partial [Consotaella sp. CSK11QG-6]
QVTALFRSIGWSHSHSIMQRLSATADRSMTSATGCREIGVDPERPVTEELSSLTIDSRVMLDLHAEAWPVFEVAATAAS